MRLEPGKAGPGERGVDPREHQRVASGLVANDQPGNSRRGLSPFQLVSIAPISTGKPRASPIASAISLR